MALPPLIFRCSLLYFLSQFAMSLVEQEQMVFERLVSRNPRIIGFYPFIIPPYKIGYVVAAPCNTTVNLEGTCTTKTKCASIGGTAYGSCGSYSRGVCCLNERSCDGNTSSRVTYFNNPGFISSFNQRSYCPLTITRQDSNICQLRIDFLTLELDPPSYDTEANYGTCKTDFLTLYDNKLRPICGKNSGKHVYLDFSPGSSTRTIAIATGASSSTEKKWSLKITQIPCNSTDNERAPAGCLMYYNTTSGSVSSFNYDIGSPTSNDQLNWTRQITNLRYSICVKPYPDFCSIEWTTSGNDSFSISNVTDVTSCQGTYVTIPGSPISNENTTDRFCGLKFPASVTRILNPPLESTFFQMYTIIIVALTLATR